VDTKTGNVLKFSNKEKLIKAQKRRIALGEPLLEELKCMPDPNCRYCYGRGYTGKDTITDLYVPCKCVK